MATSPTSVATVCPAASTPSQSSSLLATAARAPRQHPHLEPCQTLMGLLASPRLRLHCPMSVCPSCQCPLPTANPLGLLLRMRLLGSRRRPLSLFHRCLEWLRQADDSTLHGPVFQLSACYALASTMTHFKLSADI